MFFRKKTKQKPNPHTITIGVYRMSSLLQKSVTHGLDATQSHTIHGGLFADRCVFPSTNDIKSDSLIYLTPVAGSPTEAKLLLCPSIQLIKTREARTKRWTTCNEILGKTGEFCRLLGWFRLHPRQPRAHSPVLHTQHPYRRIRDTGKTCPTGL